MHAGIAAVDTAYSRRDAAGDHRSDPASKARPILGQRSRQADLSRQREVGMAEREPRAAIVPMPGTVLPCKTFLMIL